jgi:hypothetical protein
MEKKCWFCEEIKDVDFGSSVKSLAFGLPHPMIEVTVKGAMTCDGAVVYHTCRKCREDILDIFGKAIKDSGWKNSRTNI